MYVKVINHSFESRPNLGSIRCWLPGRIICQTLRYQMMISVWSCHFLNELHRTDDCKLDRSDADEEGIAYYNQTNLAIKGIIAIGAMSKMSSYAGRTADAQRYSVCISCLTLYRKINQPIGYNRSPLRWMENDWVRQWPTPPHILWRRWLLVDIRLQSICW